MTFTQNVLFDLGSYSIARAFHECKDHQQAALRWLRSQSLPKVAYEQQHSGARLAPVIERLRNGWGFEIEKVSNGPYLELFGRKQVHGWTVFGNQVSTQNVLAI